MMLALTTEDTLSLAPLPARVGFDVLKLASEQAPELTLLIDRHCVIEYANLVVRRLLGHQPAGIDVYTLIHPDDHAPLASRFNRLHPDHTVKLPAFRVQDAGGGWVRLTGRATHLLNHPDVQALLVHLEAEGSASDYSAAFARISRSLSGTYDVAAVVDAVLSEGLKVLQADAGGISLLHADESVLELIGHAGYLEEATNDWNRFPLSLDTPITDAVRQGRAVFLSDTEFRDQYPHIHQLHAPAFQSAAVLPLLIGGRAIGALSLSFCSDRSFSADEQAFLSTIADQCAPALDRSRLYQELQREQDWYRTVTQNSSDVVTILDAEDVITYASGSVARVLGYAPTELLGQNAFDLIHPNDRSPTRRLLAGARPEGEPEAATYRCLHRAGHWVWLESLGVDLQEHPHVRGILINSRDVTTREEARIAQEQTREALEHSERNFRRLAENSSDMIRQYTRDGQVEYSSPSATELLGYDSEALLNVGVLDLVHPDDRPALLAAFQIRFTPEFERQKYEYRLRHKDGTYRWVETTFKALRDVQSQAVHSFVATTRGIEERKRAELQLRAQLERYRQLRKFTVSLEHLSTPVELATETLHQCLNLSEYRYGAAYEFADGAVHLLAQAGDAPGQDLSQLPVTLPPVADHILQALRRGEAYFLEDTTPVCDPPEALPRRRWASLGLLPITRQGELVALLCFGTDDALISAAETRQLLQSMGERLSHALERQHHLTQLNTSREETLRALGLALEYRDYETKGHTDRVVHLTEALGSTMGFSGADLDALRWGAFLHDTGKVAIPDAILLKPGKLTPEEWDVIKRHPTIGFDMLHHIPSLPSTTLEIVLYHQERWNGSGYPKGLEGTSIPLAARVFAVVDVYDALTSERPYKRAWTPAEAVEQLRKEAGVLLDPRVVDAFIHTLKRTAANERIPKGASTHE